MGGVSRVRNWKPAMQDFGEFGQSGAFGGTAKRPHPIQCIKPRLIKIEGAIIEHNIFFINAIGYTQRAMTKCGIQFFSRADG